VEFVADESCDFAVVRALRANGHQVIAIAEVSPRIPDEQVLRLASAEGRVLVTEDKDFGELVYAQKQVMSGVVLLRFPGDARTTMAQATVDAVKAIGTNLSNRFTVVEPGRIRSRGVIQS
jgi:predicted nuclease of predicted toxin-antitoxin system